MSTSSTSELRHERGATVWERYFLHERAGVVPACRLFAGDHPLFSRIAPLRDLWQCGYSPAQQRRTAADRPWHDLASGHGRHRCVDRHRHGARGHRHRPRARCRWQSGAGDHCRPAGRGTAGMRDRNRRRARPRSGHCRNSLRPARRLPHRVFVLSVAWLSGLPSNLTIFWQPRAHASCLPW